MKGSRYTSGHVVFSLRQVEDGTAMVKIRQKKGMKRRAVQPQQKRDFGKAPTCPSLALAPTKRAVRHTTAGWCWF